MKLKVIGSGSSGNCYILENDNEALIIEAGLPFMEVKKALNFNIKKIVGVVASHIHKDHSGYIEQYKGICPIWEPYEVFSSNQWFGKFKVIPFELIHDVPCYGFYIMHPDIGCFVYASDTEYIKYRFRGINHLLVEANYSSDIMEAYNESNTKRAHVLTGHMELKTTLRFIQTNDNDMLNEIILCHLSESNADEDIFLRRTEEITDKKVYIARKGLEVDLSLCPF